MFSRLLLGTLMDGMVQISKACILKVFSIAIISVRGLMEVEDALNAMWVLVSSGTL